MSEREFLKKWHDEFGPKRLRRILPAPYQELDLKISDELIASATTRYSPGELVKIRGIVGRFVKREGDTIHVDVHGQIYQADYLEVTVFQKTREEVEANMDENLKKLIQAVRAHNAGTATPEQLELISRQPPPRKL